MTHIKLLESFDELDTLVVGGPDKRFPCHVQF